MKSHYLYVLVPVIWLFLIDIYFTLPSMPICLTWISTGNYLNVECTVQMARSTDSIFIVDPFDNNRVQCTFKEATMCSGGHNHVLHEDISKNITTLTLKIEKNNTEGEWTCRHRNEMAKSYVSYTEGSSPMIDVKMYGEIWKTKDNNGFKLACYSCWKPNVEGVDFYVNDMLEDSIRYNDGLCYHKRNLCRPETCTCLSRGKSFTWNYTSDLSYIQFSCEMRFKDLSQSTIIGYKTDLIYNGSVFIQKQKTNISITHSDNILDGTFEDEEKTDNLGKIGYTVLGTFGLMILFILIICLLMILNKRKTTGQEQDNYLQLLQYNITNQREIYVSFIKMYKLVLAENSIDEFAISSNARDHLSSFGFELLKGWGVVVENDRVSFYMNKLQNLDEKCHTLLHGMTSCLFQCKSFKFLRLYDVGKFKLSNLILYEDIYNELNKVFGMIIDMKKEQGWYHYRRNGLNGKGPSEGAFDLVKNVYLEKKPTLKFRQFLTVESRLQTFQDYPIENKLYRENLAMAGFFYFNISDYVQCFDCGGCLRSWKYTINPMVRHRENFKTCHFVMHSELQGSSILDAELVTYEDRLNSFKSFPGTLSQVDVEQLARAYFYYCGIAEDIVCSACDIGFARVQNSENILRLHTKYSPECPHGTQENELALRDELFDQNCISSFVEYLEIEYREHVF